MIIFWKKISDFKIFSLLKIFLHENLFLNFSVSCVSASCGDAFSFPVKSYLCYSLYNQTRIAIIRCCTTVPSIYWFLNMILAFVLNFMAVAIFVLIDFKYIHIFEQVMILAQ